MADSLRLVVWTPEETLVEAIDVQWVHVHLSSGKGLTIWPGHAPLLAETVAEALQYADKTSTHMVDLPPGTLQVRDDAVTLFLARTVGEQAWERTEEDSERLDRLAETLLAASHSSAHR